MLALLLACRDPAGPPPGADPAGALVEDLGPAGLLGRRLAVTGTRTVECTSPDDAEERHVLPDVTGEVAVYGLLPLTTYRCSARSDAGGAPTGAVTFETAALPDLPSFTVTGETTGYTLLNTQRGAAWDADPSWLLIVDPEGRVRWVYEIGTDLVCDIDAQVFDGNVHVGGGWAYFADAQPNLGVFRDVDLAGDVLLERTAPDFGRGFNHHGERLADGTYLSLTGSTDRLGDHEWNGIGVELWHPEDGLVWTWESQGLVDQGLLPEPDPGTGTPWLANAVALVTDALGDAAWISIYTRRELWRIDRASGEITSLLGSRRSTWVLQDVDGHELPDAEWPWSQHDPEWTPDGRVLLYDNGNSRPGGSYSRVAEYTIDPVAEVATLLWSWSEPGWYDPTLGDADRLPDGHVLIAQGFNRNKTPDSPDTSEVVELAPPDEVVWRLTFDSGEWPMYRAERVDGCDLFANTRYCSDR